MLDFCSDIIIPLSVLISGNSSGLMSDSEEGRKTWIKGADFSGRLATQSSTIHALANNGERETRAS